MLCLGAVQLLRGDRAAAFGESGQVFQSGLHFAGTKGGVVPGKNALGDFSENGAASVDKMDPRQDAFLGPAQLRGQSFRFTLGGKTTISGEPLFHRDEAQLISDGVGLRLSVPFQTLLKDAELPGNFDGFYAGFAPVDLMFAVRSVKQKSDGVAPLGRVIQLINQRHHSRQNAHKNQ